jgi:hypothetical protein
MSTSSSRLQLVFLGRLIEGETSDDSQMVLWHDLNRGEIHGLSDVWHDTVPMEDDEQTADLFETTSIGEIDTPFPALLIFEDEPPSRTDSAKAMPPSLKALPAMEAPSRLVVFCPNCGERQTMRVLCRGCASFLEVAMKAKAERHEQARARARSSSLLALFGS